MNILALETTGPDCSVALRVAGEADRVLTETIGRGHAERLAPMAQRLLAEAGLEPARLDRIAVAIGPGNFAGTRVGVAFARGLALATGATALGIGNLAVLARQIGGETPLVLLHDARRGDVVLQIFHTGQAHAPERLALSAVPARLAALAAGSLRIAGSGAGLSPGPDLRPVETGPLDLNVLLDLAAETDPAAAPPSPFYARPPDAKLPGGVEPA